MIGIRMFAVILLAGSAMVFGQNITELPVVDSLVLSMTQTGYDYDGDKGVEIIAWFAPKTGGNAWKPCVFSTVKNKYIYISPIYLSTTGEVISGDFNGDGRMDIAIGRSVICF